MKHLFLSFRNHLLTSFIPWIFFAVLYGSLPEKRIVASIGAAALMILLNKKELKKMFVLPWGSLIFFILAGMNTIFAMWPWGESHAFRIVNSALAVIVIISMILGRPFTLQYAREEVDRAHWRKPLFLKINWILTTIWALLLIVMALPSYLLTQDQIRQDWFWNYGLSILCIVTGLFCNKKIPPFFR